MVITYYGHEFFKVQFGDTTVAVNPISKQSKLKTSRFGADIALVGMRDHAYNGVEQVQHGGKEPFVISGPGEYEVRGVNVRGFPSTEETSPGKIKTLYTLSLEGIELSFLSALDAKKLPGKVQEAITGSDMLFVPIGGTDVLNAQDAYALAVTLEPKIIIPMHYTGSDGAKALKAFLKEGGAESTKPVEKFTVKRRDITEKEGEIVVIAPS